MSQTGFPNMGGARPPQQMNQQPGGMQRNGGASSDIQASILNNLQSRPVPPGWQQTIPVRQRANIIFQMVTQLRIVKPDITLQYAISVAMHFENELLATSPDSETYHQDSRSKLQEIHATRQNQANLQQQQFQSQQAAQMGLPQQQIQTRNMMNGQNQFQPGFGMPQSQQPGQVLGIPMQQQLSQNQRLFQNGNPMEMQPQIQNVPRPGVPNRPQQPFTPEETQQVNNIIRQLLARMPDQERLNILRQIPAQQQQAMQDRNLDPILLYVRNQAGNIFLNERQKRLQANGQNHPPSLAGPMSSQASQGPPNSQVPMRNHQPPHPPPGTQQPDSTFGMGSIEQFMGQQQEGLRHQAAGQDVVPASNSQAALPQMRGTPHHPPQNQFPPNRPMQAPSFTPQTQTQTQWNGPQNQQPGMHPTPHMPMQPPPNNLANMQGQTPQQQALQGQLGGLGNGRGQRTPQGHSLPTLNRPMDPPNQAKNELNPRPSQPTPKQGQRNTSSGQQVTSSIAQPSQPQQSQPGVPLPGQWAKLPPKLRQTLQRMPEDKRKQFFMEMTKKQQQQKRAKAAAEGQNGGNTQNVPTQGPQGMTVGVRTTQANDSQTTTTANPTSSQPSINPFGQINMAQQQGPQPGPPESGHLPQQRMPPMPLNDVQVRFMDNQAFPPSILNKSNRLGQLPESVKTWGQLKEYVQQGAQSLPQGSLQSLVGLQSIHLQQMQFSSINQKRMQPTAQGNVQPGQTGQAPQAPPMIPPHPNQTPVPGAVPPGQFSVPQIPRPTMHDIHAARAVLPDNMKGVSDNQLATMIFQRRQQEFLKANQQRLNPQQQQVLQRNSLLQLQRLNNQNSQDPIQSQPRSMSQAPRIQGQPPPPAQQPQQPIQPPQPTKPLATPQGRQPQLKFQNQMVQGGQKGAKSSTNDDVVEVPDPKSQQQWVPTAKPGQPPQMTAPGPMPPEAFARLTNEQKAQLQARMREAHTQRAKLGMTNQTPSRQASAASTDLRVGSNAGQNLRRDPVLEALAIEVAQTTPQRPIVPMSPKTRNQMVEKLRESTANVVQRVEESLPVFLSMTKNKDQIKDLLRMRLMLLRQVQDAGFTNPVDNFTMTIQEVEEYKTKFHSYFAYMLRCYQPQVTSAPPTAQASSGQPQQLNAANLQQQQETLNAARVASAQKNQTNNGSRAPAAPTATHPPFSIGSQSPQGVRQLYDRKNELTQEQLKLPQAKKRKPNQSASIPPVHPMNTQANKSSPAAKIESPEAPRAPLVPNMLKCSVLDCESGKGGFLTKDDLERHRREVHEPKEPAIKDPLDAAAYAIESLRIALNLDENGKSKTVAPPIDEDKGSLQAPAMKTSASSQSQNIKQEAATPMSRIPTQTGPSPSSNLLRTPQAAVAVRTPASDSKPAVKDGRSKEVATSPSIVMGSDPWASSKVKPQWFKEVFSDVASLNRTVPDGFITSWLERNPFTPPTTPSSGANDKDSPHKSDISANDNLNINVMADDEDWMLSEWDDRLQGGMEALDVGDLMDINWDLPEDKSEEKDNTTGKGKRRRDPRDPSDEWMKAWAPERYEENKRQDAQRKR